MGLLGSCCGKTDPSKTDTSMPGIELEKASATPHFQWAARNGPGAPRGPIVPKGPIVLVDEGTHAMQGAWWPGLWGQPEESGGSEDAARTPCQWRNRARAHKTRSDCASAHATHRHHHDEQDPQPKRPHAAGGASPAGEPTSVRHSQPPRAFGWCNLISGALAATGSALRWPNSGDFNSRQRRLLDRRDRGVGGDPALQTKHKVKQRTKETPRAHAPQSTYVHSTLSTL